MQANMGNLDRIIRIIAAVVLGVLYFTGTVTGAAGVVLAVIAAILLLTSLVNFCPIYRIFGMSTCARR